MNVIGNLLFQEGCLNNMFDVNKFNIKKCLYKSWDLYTKEEEDELIKDVIDMAAENDEVYTEDEARETAIEFADDTYFSDFKANVECANHPEGNYIIHGILGLWDGTHRIVPTVEKTLWGAISRCIQDMDSVEIGTSKEGNLVVIAHHHDGTNKFLIRYGRHKIKEVF